VAIVVVVVVGETLVAVIISHGLIYIKLKLVPDPLGEFIVVVLKSIISSFGFRIPNGHLNTSPIVVTLEL
jgi:hypothetical protein